jgi:hypothetical protein
MDAGWRPQVAFANETFDLAIAYNVLMDIEDIPMAL